MCLFKKYFLKVLLLISFHVVASCTFSVINDAEEFKINEIKLIGEASLAEKEISGLTWLGDYLILLPQYPFNLDGNISGEIYKLYKW